MAGAAVGAGTRDLGMLQGGMLDAAVGTSSLKSGVAEMEAAEIKLTRAKRRNAIKVLLVEMGVRGLPWMAVVMDVMDLASVCRATKQGREIGGMKDLKKGGYLNKKQKI